MSNYASLLYWVPTGLSSVANEIVFEIVIVFAFTFYDIYADNTQLYVSFKL